MLTRHSIVPCQRPHLADLAHFALVTNSRLGCSGSTPAYFCFCASKKQIQAVQAVLSRNCEGSLGILREHPNGRHEHAKAHFRVSLQTFTSPFSFFFVDYSPMEAMSYKSFQLNQIDSELLCLSRASQSDIHTETHGAGAVAFSGTFKSFSTNSAPGHIWRI